MPSRARTRVGVVLLVLAGLLLPLAVVATWTARTVTDTDAFVARVTPAGSTPEVRAYLEEQLAEQVRRAVVEDRLAPRVSGAIEDLAAPAAVKDLLRDVATALADVVDSAARRGVERALADPAFPDSFAAAVATAHGEIVAALDGESAAVVTEDGTVRIRLAALGDRVRSELSANGYTFVERLPRTEASVPVATVERLETWQRWYGLLRILRWLGPALVVLLVAAGTWLCRDLAVSGVWFGATALLALVAVTVVVRAAVRSTMSGVADPLAVDAAGAVLASITATLTRNATVVGLLVVLLLAVSAWVAARRRLHPAASG